MNLTESQRDAVAEWFAAGASLDEIQKRLRSEFGVHMTYLDLRLMVAELPQPKEEEPEIPEAADDSDVPENPEHSDVPDVPDNPDSPEDPEASGNSDSESQAANVTVDLDAITIPGTMASGNVTFTDGTKGKWYLDGYGRLGLGETPPGYRPPPADAALFQARLMELLRSRGMI